MDSTNVDDDKRDDTARAFGEIHPSSEAMRKEMVAIARHNFKRSQDHHWMTMMRFLAINKPSDFKVDETLSGTEQPTEKRVESDSPVIVSVVGQKQLVRPFAYVAVSYCWSSDWLQTPADWPPGREPRQVEIIGPGRQPSPNVVALEVLHRAATYAVEVGLDMIWIDQECIDQSNVREKAVAIQNMDMVYQQAEHAIAILETYLDTQEELLAFATLFHQDYPFQQFDASRLEALENVLATLANDSWFSRAWTLQEATSAGVSMALLIPCHPDLEKPSIFGPIVGEIVVSIRDFQEAMVYARNMMEEYLASGLCEDESVAVQISNCADVLWNFIPTVYPEAEVIHRDSSHRQKCNAAEALSFLDDRENSFFPDRLAILANLCNYEYRIAPHVLETPGHGFSTCALVLAILNGDMSLLGGYTRGVIGARDKNGPAAWTMDLARDGRSVTPVFASNDTDSLMKSYGFSWGPEPTGSLINITYHEENGDIFRLNPGGLSETGLKVLGILWGNFVAIRVPRTQKLITERWATEIEPPKEAQTNVIQAHNHGVELAQDSLWELFHELFDLGFPSLCKTLWNYFQPWGVSKFGWKSKREAHPYLFEHVFGAPDRALEQDIVKSQMRTESLYIDIENPVYESPTPSRVLLEHILRTGAITCGGQAHPTTNAEPRVMFEACQRGDLVFTPLTSLGDRAAESTYRSQAMSWKVTRTGHTADGCEILHCLGRRRGFWRMDDLCREANAYVLD